VNALACHPRANTFLTGGADGEVTLWNAETKRKQGSTPIYHTAVSSIDVSSDGMLVCIGLSYGGEVGDKRRSESSGEVRERPRDAIVVRSMESFAKKDKDTNKKKKT
jgi:cell cycle arrest protein BUB3